MSFFELRHRNTVVRPTSNSISNAVMYMFKAAQSGFGRFVTADGR